MDRQPEVICEACNIHLHPNNAQAHFMGRKHIAKQEQFNKIHNSVFVSGTTKFTPQDLKNIFKKYGEVSHITKQKSQAFAFIQFVDKSSVEKALTARIFAGGIRLFVRKYDENRNKPNNSDEKSRKLSDTSSVTSQTEVSETQLGVEELPVELPDPSLCPDNSDVFEWQVQQFISQVEMPRDMYYCLNEVEADMENMFRPALPGCRVIVFGSCGSTLAFKNSDVDLFLQTKGDQPTDFVRKEAKVMYRSRQFKVVARIPSARVPIVKFEHLRTGWQGDLTANSRLGVCNSQLIRFLMSLDPRIRPLVMVIKYWAKVCEVTGSHQRLTTYSLVMLVIFYLQQLDPPILPSVVTLQNLADHKEFSLGWECSFSDEEWKIQSEVLTKENKLSLKELLSGFFNFYNTFDFNNVICPLLGHAVPVTDFEEPDKLPNEMQLYKEKLKSDPKLQFKTNVLLRVQDPFELCLNITRNVIDRTYFIFRKACAISSELCEKTDKSSLLSSLFRIDKDSLDTGEHGLKLHIPFKHDSDSTSPVAESDLIQWYELTTEAILLVMTEVLKFHVEPNNVEVSNKVKKLESSKDVHTSPKSFKSCDDLNYLCHVKANVWNSRKKVSKFLNSLKISLWHLCAFEREVCISNSLYRPDDSNAFTFNMTVSSLDKFKNKPKGVDLFISNKKAKGKSLMKEMVNFLKYNTVIFVLQAAVFITKTKESSTVTEVKESLKELFDLKLATLPDLKTYKDQLAKSLEQSSDLSKNDEQLKKTQNLLMQNLEKCKQNTEECSLESVSTCHTKNSNKNCQEVHPKADVSKAENKDFENNVKNSTCLDQISSNKNLPSVETQELINQFFKPTNPHKVNELKSPDLTSDNSNVEKFSNMLETIKQVETQSTFSCDTPNPFLKSIEKVALKSVVTSDDNNDKITTDVNLDKDKNVHPSGSCSTMTAVDLVDQEKNISALDNCESQLANKEEQKPNIKSVPQRPKIYLETPQKFRKRNNYKPDTRKLEPRKSGSAQFRQQAQQRRMNQVSTTGYQYYSERVENNFNRSDRQQQHLSASVDRHKTWYPTLFKQN